MSAQNISLIDEAFKDDVKDMPISGAESTRTATSPNLIDDAFAPGTNKPSPNPAFQKPESPLQSEMAGINRVTKEGTIAGTRALPDALLYGGLRSIGGLKPEEAQKHIDARVPGISDVFKQAQKAIGAPSLVDEVKRLVGLDSKLDPSIAEKNMEFVSKYYDKGVDWISQQLKIPKQDAEHLVNAVTSGGGYAAAKGALKVPGAIADVGGAIKKASGFKESSSMSGVGAAQVEKAAFRQARANELDIPIKFMRYQLTRDPAEIRLATDLAKTDVGRPIRDGLVNENRLIEENLNSMVDKVGAESTGKAQFEVGEEFKKTITDYKTLRHDAAQAQYDLAGRHGETAKPVNYRLVSGYINHIKKTNPTKFNRNPILQEVLDEFGSNDPKGKGTISVNNMEEIRKSIVADAELGTTSGIHGERMIAHIDTILDKVPGLEYQKARKLWSDYRSDFYDHSLVKKMWGYNKGSKDPIVSPELIVDTLINKSKSTSIKHFWDLVGKMPDPEAFRTEIRGQVAQYIRDKSVGKSIVLDESSNDYVSPAVVRDTIRQLDKSGSLDLIFGKKEAEKYRTLVDVARELLTNPRDTTNPSGSASSFRQMVEAGVFAGAGVTEAALFGGTPVVSGVLAGLRYGIKGTQHLREKAEVKRQLNATPESIKRDNQ